MNKQNEKYNIYASIIKFNVKNNIIECKMNISADNINEVKIEKGILKLRNNDILKEIQFEIKNIWQKENKAKIVFKVNLKELDLIQFYWDFYLVINIKNQEIRKRVKNPTYLVKKKLNRKIISYTFNFNNGYIIYPYITLNNGLSLAYRKKGQYESIKFKLMEKLAVLIYYTFKWHYNKKNIWLIHEKLSETAQDNSYYFFKYCYLNKKTENVYYIIKRDSPDYENIYEMKDKVLNFMTLRHLIYLCASKLIISSETKSHGYAWRVQRGKIKHILNKKKIVFLQHGVIGFKKIDYIYKKGKLNTMDLFVVSSEHEKNLLKKYFNYNDNEIIITGLSRWDVLKDEPKNNSQILLMPTWRNWLEEISQKDFINSKYFNNYMNLLNSTELKNLLKQNNIIMNFYVHPKFMIYVKKFHTQCKNIRIVRFGEQKVNELLMKSALLITDYSSVAWDIYYQNKPTIFYQFDVDEYNLYQGSYIQMDKELIGDRVTEVNQLIECLKYYINNSFQQKLQYRQKRKYYFKYIDNRNSERIFNEIIKRENNLIQKNRLKHQFKNNELIILIWSKFKKNKLTKNIALKLKNIIFKS